MTDFLTSFDARTVALLTAFSFFILTSAIGAQAFLIRNYRGIKTALIGNLSIALGFFLGLLRGILPDFIPIVLANALIVLAPGLFYIAVSHFAGQKYWWWIVAITVGVTAICMFYFRFVTNNIGIRIVYASLFSALNLGALVYQLWKIRHASYRFGAMIINISCSIYILVLLVRAGVAIISPPQDLFSNLFIATGTYFLLFIISFLWTFGFILMVSQRLQFDLYELATVDSLTRIANRRATQSFLEREFARVERARGEFSVLLIDVDNFKQINDRNGHDVGDNVLIKSAEVFQRNIRKQDLVGRWGGDEFLIVLSDTTVNNAENLAERVRDQIKTTAYRGLKLPVTISAGVASSKPIKTIDQLLKVADNALYTAKTKKNTIVIANPEIQK